MSGLWRPIVWSKSEKFWSFSHPSAPRNANALDGDKPTQSFPRRSCNIFRGWEMSELEENIREYSSRNWNDTWYIDFLFRWRKVADMGIWPKLKNFCTWVAFIRNMDSHDSQNWSSSTDKPNEALPPCGPCDFCWVQDVRKGEVNVQRFVSLVTWPHLSFSCQGSTRYLCTCHNHCQRAFPWCNTKGLNQDKFKSAKPISFCTSLLTTSCSIVPHLAISPYRTTCLAVRYIPISWNVYSVLSYNIRLYHVFSYYLCTPVKTGAHPPVAICLWQGSFLWAVSNPNTLEQSWGTDFWEIKKVWGWTHKRY